MNHCCEWTVQNLPQSLCSSFSCLHGLLQPCAALSAELEVSCRCMQRSQLFRNLIIWIVTLVASCIHLHNWRCFQEHLRMLLQSLRAQCKAPGGPGASQSTEKDLWGLLECLRGLCVACRLTNTLLMTIMVQEFSQCIRFLLAHIPFHAHLNEDPSAQCNSIRKPHPNFAATPVALTSISKYFDLLWGPPGAFQCALGLCESIPRCFWKHQPLCRGILDTTRLTVKIVKFWSYWDLSTALRELLRAAETYVQAVWETWCQILTAVVLRQQWFLLFQNH